MLLNFCDFCYVKQKRLPIAGSRLQKVSLKLAWKVHVSVIASMTSTNKSMFSFFAKRLKIDCVKLTALIENERKVLVVMKQLNRPNQPQGSAGIGKCKLIGNANPVGHCLLCRL